MLRNWKKSLLLLFISFISGSLYCVNSGVSDSGGGIDIGNPVKICVVDSLDKPVVGASVRLIRSNQWYSSILGGRSEVSDSTATGKSGFAAFDSLDSSIYNLQVDHAAGGAFVADFDVTDSQNIKVIRIKKYAVISGIIKSKSGRPSGIRLAGTAYRASIDSNGFYMLSTSVNGMCTPVVMASDSHVMFTDNINIISSDTTVNVEDVPFNTLLIDDFEDSASTAKLGQFVNGSRIYTDETYGSVQYQIAAGGYNSKNAMAGKLITNGAYSLIGFFLGIKPDSDSVWDFRAAAGLSFHAKGSGKLNISIESDSIEKMGSYKHYSADIVLQPQWQLFHIKFDTLKFKADLNPDPAVTWNESAGSIKKIEFNALEGDTVQFWLDNLIVNGIDISEIYK